MLILGRDNVRELQSHCSCHGEKQFKMNAHSDQLRGVNHSLKKYKNQFQHLLWDATWEEFLKLSSPFLASNFIFCRGFFRILVLFLLANISVHYPRHCTAENIWHFIVSLPHQSLAIYWMHTHYLALLCSPFNPCITFVCHPPQQLAFLSAYHLFAQYPTLSSPWCTRAPVKDTQIFLLCHSVHVPAIPHSW